MHRIQDLIGRESESDSVNRALQSFAQAQRAAAVGAVHVTCSDETERETAETFQRWFADALLPELKFWSKAPFRSANLGNRYEWGAVRIAESHFATAETRDAFKLLLVKISAHVAVNVAGGKTTYGTLDRYQSASPCCGALDALLSGLASPATEELRTMFDYDRLPRLDLLLDPAMVDPELRGFVAAVVNARLQARSAIVDIQDYRPTTPTVTVVVPSVTMNRKQRDSEFVVGMYWADSRGAPGEATYLGLGDDPSRYRISQRHGYLRVSDEGAMDPRQARDHRQEVLAAAPHGSVIGPLNDPRWHAITDRLTQDGTPPPKLAYEALKTALSLAADIAPIPASILLFARGLAGIHHLYRVHQLARGQADADEARRVIEEVAGQADRIPESKVRDILHAVFAGDHGCA